MFFSVGLFILRRPICVKTRECEGEKSLGLFFYSVFVPDAYDFLIVNVCKDFEALSSWDMMMLGSIFPGEDYFSQRHNLGVCISLKKKLKRSWKKLPAFFHSNQERTLAADQVGRRRAKRDANRRKTWRPSRWDWTEETNYTFPAKNVAPTYFICGASLITLPEEVLFSESVFWIYAARKSCLHEKCAQDEALQHQSNFVKALRPIAD